MTNPNANLEPRVIELRSATGARLEIDMVELKQSVSDLRSTVATLADLITIQQNEAQADREQARADTLMLQLIQAIEGQNGGN